MVRGITIYHADYTPEQPHLFQRVLVQKKLLPPCAARHNVYRREDSPLRQFSIQMELHVASSLELLIYEVIHAATGIHEASGYYSDTSTLICVAGGAEEAFRGMQGG
jgi:hypothetical protein